MFSRPDLMAYHNESRGSAGSLTSSDDDHDRSARLRTDQEQDNDRDHDNDRDNDQEDNDNDNDNDQDPDNDGSSASGSATAQSQRRGTARKWTAAEDGLLLAGIARYGLHSWKLVSALVGTRDAAKCMQRYTKGLRPGLVKGRWTPEEDARLRDLVLSLCATHQQQQHADGIVNTGGLEAAVASVSWAGVAAAVSGRTAKQCRERWFNFLCPTLRRGPFTAEEDRRLRALVRELGPRWAAIARRMEGRTENAVKVRCNALHRMRRLHCDDFDEADIEVEAGSDAKIEFVEAVESPNKRRRLHDSLSCSTSTDESVEDVNAAQLLKHNRQAHSLQNPPSIFFNFDANSAANLNMNSSTTAVTSKTAMVPCHLNKLNFDRPSDLLSFSVPFSFSRDFAEQDSAEPNLIPSLGSLDFCEANDLLNFF